MLIGLTGGIASGKSTASKILQGFGAEIIDADKIAHKILEKGEEGWQRVKDYFGPDILTENREIDRSQLGQIVFNHPAERKQLERLTHPLIIRKIKSKMTKKLHGNKHIVLDAPLLYETSLDRLVDQVWVVYVNREIQLERLKQRNGITRDEARRRIESQMPLRKKKNMADVVIDNTGDRDFLYRQLEELWYNLNK